TILATALVTNAPADEPATITIHADKVLHTLSRHLTGACIEDVNHEIYGGLYSQMIFGESFQEPPTAPLVKGFKSFGGSWSVRDGILSIDAGDGPKLVSDHPAFADGAAGVEIMFRNRDGQNAGLIARVQRPHAGADSFIGYEISLDPARQIVRLARHRNNYQLIEDAKCDVPIGKWISLEVRLHGPEIQVLVDGKSVLDHREDTNALPGGMIGLRGWHEHAEFRNFWVNQGGAPEPVKFEETEAPTNVSGMWRPVVRGSAHGGFSIVTKRPYIGTQSQQITFASGNGEIGISNQGLNHWGMNFIQGKPYEGYAWVRAEKPVTLFASMESHDGSRRLAEKSLNVSAGDWQRVDFTLTPSGSDSNGQFVLSLKQPGTLVIGHAFMQPGEWGRFKGLPVRRDVAEGMINQGITVLRYGGSKANAPAYRWKKMIGPRDHRPPYAGTWYPYSSNGWGIIDFISFCEAAGFEYVPAFNIDESPQDMADFVDYVKSPATSEWGRKRAEDGHPQPFSIHLMELGNEERVDERYAQKFEGLASAIWAKDPDMILVVGDFAYGRPIEDPFNFTGAASRITTLAGQQRILRFAKAHNGQVWFDIHVDTDRPVAVNNSLVGMLSFADAIDKLAEGAKHRVVVFELNANNHGQRRALANAMAITDIERDGRMPIVTSANGLQCDGQNDNGWDQGLLFLNPSQVWLQAPGYVTQMLSRSYQPRVVQCDVSEAGKSLDALATLSGDGKTLVLQVTNPGDQQVSTTINFASFAPANQQIKVTELAGPPSAVNSAQNPQNIVPREAEQICDGKAARFSFQPHSFTIIEFR
ncbi:MAG TPA: family 16 glycoside hydrolase, partial [Tepidisphaeraceae bacterium]|nr:family 16 glycoside hydrolase [Tepidisphaeraceae bacterium]